MNALVHIPPPVWTLAMLILAYFAQRSAPWAGIVHMRSLPAAMIVAAAGLGLSVWGALTFSAEGTELEPASVSNKVLVTRGPFRFTRNPMYLGLIGVSLGIALYFGTIPFFIVPLLVFLLCNFVFIPFEEAKMHRQFGPQYTHYLGRVRRWI